MKHHKDGHKMHHGSHHTPGGDPDKGPPMNEGEIRFDKGYKSDDEHFSPHGLYPGEHERGNHYMHLQNEAVERDSKKLKRSHFTKIA